MSAFGSSRRDSVLAVLFVIALLVALRFSQTATIPRTTAAINQNVPLAPPVSPFSHLASANHERNTHISLQQQQNYTTIASLGRTISPRNLGRDTTNAVVVPMAKPADPPGRILTEPPLHHSGSCPRLKSFLDKLNCSCGASISPPSCRCETAQHGLLYPQPWRTMEEWWAKPSIPLFNPPADLWLAWQPFENIGDVVCRLKLLKNTYVFQDRHCLDGPIQNRSIVVVAIYTLHKLLPKLASMPHFFLVTGGFGNVNPAYQPAIRAVLDSPKLLLCFAQNVDMEHPKLVGLPLGAHKLQRGLAEAMPWMATIRPDKLVHAQFFYHRTMTRCVGWEADQSHVQGHCLRGWLVRDILPKAGIHLSVEKTNRTMYYKNMLRSKFVLSPPGVDIDAIRTWESLCLGRVPVVPNNGLRQLYYGLPVVVLDKWEDLHASKLEALWPSLLTKRFDWGKTSFLWWAMKIYEQCLHHS